MIPILNFYSLALKSFKYHDAQLARDGISIRASRENKSRYTPIHQMQVIFKTLCVVLIPLSLEFAAICGLFVSGSMGANRCWDFVRFDVLNINSSCKLRLLHVTFELFKVYFAFPFVLSCGNYKTKSLTLSCQIFAGLGDVYAFCNFVKHKVGAQ